MKKPGSHVPSRDIQTLLREIRQLTAKGQLTIMEVCGTHTMAIARSGLRMLLPANIRLISGPGCPVCVTPVSFIDHAVLLSRIPDVVITTFGDLVRVPGSGFSLEEARERGADIRIVTSALQSVMLAQSETQKKIIFLGVGFETTIPTIAAAIQHARKTKLSNFYVLPAHKTMPRAMTALCRGDIRVDAFLCPGHVSAITGLAFYDDIVRNFRKICVVAGFEPEDILEGIWMICRQFKAGEAKVENQYQRVVTEHGNSAARDIMNSVFEPDDAEWRGLGTIPGSGMRIRSAYQEFDASEQFSVQVNPAPDPPGCRCGEVLTGKMKPEECPLFQTKCTPERPVGPCMVSSEGSCAAAYQYAPENESTGQGHD